MIAPALGAVVLGSRRPARLRRWYELVLGDPYEEAGDVARFALGNIELVIVGHGSLDRTAPDPQRMMLTFVVADVAAIEATLVAMQAVWVRELEQTPGGVIGTVVDPDGNHVQLIQPTSGVSK